MNHTEEKSYRTELWPLIEFFLPINDVISCLSYQTSKQQHAGRRVLRNALTASAEHDQVLPLQRFPHHSRLWSSCCLDSFHGTHPPQQDTGSELRSQFCHACTFCHHITDNLFFFFIFCGFPLLAVVSFLPAPVSWWRGHGANLQAGAAFERAAGVLLCSSRAAGEPSVANRVNAGVGCTLDKRE